MTNDVPISPHTARGPVEGEDWEAVARTLNRRMATCRIGQQALADAARVSASTVRALQRGSTDRRVQNSTLTAISRALGWRDDHLLRVLLAEPPEADPKTSDYVKMIFDSTLRIERHLREISKHFTEP
ncbi:helix-turn-helix domain-containing protein [Pseudofrankia inefficax]|nr:helix-turn-helix domain-containing protein [Pseudofrankia inefficax]